MHPSKGTLSALLILSLCGLQACERDMTFGEQPDIPASVEEGEDPADTVLEAENQLQEQAGE